MQTVDATTTPPASPISAPQRWWGKTTTNISSTANKWLGRNRPVTGAGATANVGTKDGAQPAPFVNRILAQPEATTSFPAVSLRPHAGGAGALQSGIFGSSGDAPDEASHAPANTKFVGLK